MPVRGLAVEKHWTRTLGWVMHVEVKKITLLSDFVWCKLFCCTGPSSTGIENWQFFPPHRCSPLASLCCLNLHTISFGDHLTESHYIADCPNYIHEKCENMCEQNQEGPEVAK